MKLRILFLICVCVSFAACKKGKSEVSNLKSLTGFLVDQNSYSVSSKTSPAFTMTGKCSSKFSDAEISVDDGSHWLRINTLATSYFMDCSKTGTFTAGLAFSGVDSSKWSSSNTYKFLIRGVSEFGYSDSIIVSLANTGGGAGSITAGGSNVPLTGVGFKLTGSLSERSAAPTSTGGNYKLQGEVLW